MIKELKNVSNNKQVLTLKDSKLVLTEEKKPVLEDKKGKQRLYESISLATDLGFIISVPLVGGALLGSFLDNKFNTSPKFTLSLIFLGVIIALFNIYKFTQKNIKE